MTPTTPRLTAAQMEQRIRAYFDDCNTGVASAIASHFVPDAVHYFPEGLPDVPFRGAQRIGEMWAWCVENLGSRWVVERGLYAPEQGEAVIEWTHWKTRSGDVVRGDEWYVFDGPTGLIREIRAFYACGLHKGQSRSELVGFDYAGQGYTTRAP